MNFQGQPAIELRSPDGAQAIVLLHGAHLVSWRPAPSQGQPAPEQLYLSERAVFAPGSAVRGGVPVIFPQFERRGPLPRHGFARTRAWQLESQRQGADHATVTLQLRANEDTRQTWPHDFVAELTLSIAAARLDMELSIENTGSTAFEFTAALHTYVRVEEARYTVIEGLEGVHYHDSLHDTQGVQSHDQLRVLPDIDRIYFDVPRPITLREPGRRLSITTQGFEDAVIWNPGEARTAALTDMPPQGFSRMCCVEAAQIQRPVRLQPADQWLGRQTLQA